MVCGFIWDCFIIDTSWSSCGSSCLSTTLVASLVHTYQIWWLHKKPYQVLKQLYMLKAKMATTYVNVHTNLNSLLMYVRKDVTKGDNCQMMTIYLQCSWLWWLFVKLLCLTFLASSSVNITVSTNKSLPDNFLFSKPPTF